MTATNPAKIQLDTKEEILKPDTKLIKDLIAEGREKGFITLDVQLDFRWIGCSHGKGRVMLRKDFLKDPPVLFVSG